MKQFINLLLPLAFSLPVQVVGQHAAVFETQVTTIDSLIEARNFSGAQASLDKLQIMVAALSDNDSAQLYFASTQAYVSAELQDCSSALTNGKRDLMLRTELYGAGDLTTIKSGMNLGIYFINCDSATKALAIFEESMKWHQTAIGEVDNLYVRILENMAYTQGKLGNYQAADKSYQELLGLLENAKSSDFYINAIDNYSAILLNQGRYKEACEFYDDLKAYAQAQTDYPSFLKDFYNAFVHQQDYVKGLETADAIVEMYQAQPALCESFGISGPNVQRDAARLAMILDQKRKALDYYKKSEALFSEDRDALIHILLEHAEVLGALNQRNQELNKLRISYSLQVENGYRDSTIYEQTLNRLCGLLTQMGQFEMADQIFQDEITYLESHPNTSRTALAKAYQALGNQRYLLQNFKDADLYFRKAESLLIKEGLSNTASYASLLNSLGALYEALADYQRAESAYRKALIIIHGDETLNLRIALTANLANILLNTDPANDSIGSLLNQAINWQAERVGTLHPDYANLLSNRGLFHQKKGAYELAKQDYLSASDILQVTVGIQHPQYLTTQSNLGLLYEVLGENDKALDLMLQTKSLYETYYKKSHPGYLLVLNNLANLFTKQEKFDQAEPLLLELSAYTLEQIKHSFTYLSEQEKKNFMLDKRKFLENFERYVVSRFSVDPASLRPDVLVDWYNLELNTRGMLLNSTQKVRNQIFESGDPELVELFAEWTVARKQVADLQSVKRTEQSSSAAMDSLRQKINALEKTLSRRSNQFNQAFTAAEVTFDSIQQVLVPGDLAVEIIKSDLGEMSVYVALIISPDKNQPELVFLGKGEDLENRSYKLYQNTIKFQIDDAQSFASYWQPIHQWIGDREINRIYFAPDGIYHRINLATMYHAEEKEYLLESYDLIQLNATKDIRRVKSRRPRPINEYQFLLLGRPSYMIGSLPAMEQRDQLRSFTFDMTNVSDLPGTQAEIMEIASLLNDQGIPNEVLIQDESTEGALKEKIKSCDVIHLATHGFFVDRKAAGDAEYIDPMLYSGLLLAGVSNKRTQNQTEDGILTAYEIMNTEFKNSDMVVLSACETGLGEITSGEGIYGLQRAFLVAGSRTIVMSLWKVDDEATKDLMSRFYKNYLKGGDKREAFLQAQKKIKKKYKSPFYWGAFVMIEG